MKSYLFSTPTPYLIRQVLLPSVKITNIMKELLKIFVIFVVP